METLSIGNKEGYLARMSASLQEKLKVTGFIPAHAKKVLDVGCADGTVTIAMAHMFPDISFLGIDLDPDFIAAANQKAKEESFENVTFRCVYLRDLLAEPARFDAVMFISVLHEFWSYGEGISSVTKALCDAHELLLPGGEIVIRDMILHEYSKRSSSQMQNLTEKVQAAMAGQRCLSDFVERWGSIKSLYELNHFLLKYFYAEDPKNWQRELVEHYVPVTVEQYQTILNVLDMELHTNISYRIPFLHEKWKQDFGFIDGELELSGLESTAFLVAKK